MAKRAPVLDDPEDVYDGSPEDALEEVEQEVKKLCAKGVTPGEAWDRAVAANPVRFAVAKRLQVAR